ncbi:MAG: hypothetical protein RLY86_140 [Pseudomonadota bacterium]|jgi:predicted RNase H-like HicB family nuclease
MPTRYFPAIVEKSSDGFYASFPDVPGCVSHGETMEILAAAAEQVLAYHIAGMVEDGTDLPVPTPLDKVERDPDVEEFARILVRADLPGKAVRVNISMEEGLLALLDREVKRRQTSRSALLAVAVRREIAGP